MAGGREAISGFLFQVRGEVKREIGSVRHPQAQNPTGAVGRFTKFWLDGNSRDNGLWSLPPENPQSGRDRSEKSAAHRTVHDESASFG